MPLVLTVFDREREHRYAVDQLSVVVFLILAIIVHPYQPYQAFWTQLKRMGMIVLGVLGALASTWLNVNISWQDSSGVPQIVADVSVDKLNDDIQPVLLNIDSFDCMNVPNKPVI